MLVVLAAVTCIVAMLLVAAIVFVRRRHHQTGVKPAAAPLAVTWVHSSTAVSDDTKAINNSTHGAGPEMMHDCTPVSYTHLTLPTNREV